MQDPHYDLDEWDADEDVISRIVAECNSPFTITEVLKRAGVDVGGLEESLKSEFDRKRGFLTDTDREFLWDLIEYKHRQTKSDRWQHIRQGTVNGVLDLTHLRLLDPDQRVKIFNTLRDEGGPAKLRSALTSLVWFLYLGFGANLNWIEQGVARGIRDAERTLQDNNSRHYTGGHFGPTVDVDITIDRGYALEEIEERYRSSGPAHLTEAEIGALVRAGRLDPDELQDFAITSPPLDKNEEG